MPAERTKRRLAAILAADVVGYSRLMGMAETETLAALKSRRRELLEPLVASHQGRVFKLTGDGVLVEFASAVDAVQCAIELQEKFAEANLSAPEDRRIVLRIGINLGDVIVEGNDLYGDGVNIAARLEAIAEPGGICVSDDAYRQVRNKLSRGFDDLGTRQLKNIAEPVRVFAVSGIAPVAGQSPSQVAAGPSIAVLPFANMSADPDQEYFSDGITEDIITDLSKVTGLMVIARNSSFVYKNKNTDIRVVGSELGVRSVLEGSIRRAGNRVRITAQLIDATTGGHLWADRYDRDLNDIFAVQDEVTRQIVSALKVTLQPSERARLAGNRTTSVEAHDYFLRGREILLGPKKDREAFDQAVSVLTRAVEIDPDYAEPYAGLAMAHVLDFQNHWTDTTNALELASTFAHKATDNGPDEPYAHFSAAVVAFWQKDLTRAKSEAEAALSLNANYALAYGILGLVDAHAGSPRSAIPNFEMAMRLDPVFKHQYLHFLGSAYLVMGDNEAAVQTLKERINLSPRTDLSRGFLVSALGQLGQIDEAQNVWRELMEVNPKYSPSEHLARLPFKNPSDAQRIRDGWVKAGVLD